MTTGSGEGGWSAGWPGAFLISANSPTNSGGSEFVAHPHRTISRHRNDLHCSNAHSIPPRAPCPTEEFLQERRRGGGGGGGGSPPLSACLIANKASRPALGGFDEASPPPTRKRGRRRRKALRSRGNLPWRLQKVEMTQAKKAKGARPCAIVPWS